MEPRAVVRTGDSIISPLGRTAEETFRSVLEGKTQLRLHEGLWNLPEPFVASLLDRELLDSLFGEITGRTSTSLTFFERMCVVSASDAVRSSGTDAASPRTLFFVSTTKSNVSSLEMMNEYAVRHLPGRAASRIPEFFGNPNPAIVVNNACTSGLCAQIAAMRALRSGRCDTAIVVGADEQSRFIVSGFQSFKALSDQTCRPFDSARKGLNLGEAAATIIYTVKDRSLLSPTDWELCAGAVRNDANHISGPSRTGEGALKALQSVMMDFSPDQLAFVSAHGTATVYNDEMEAVAIDRAGLSGVPVNALKGCFGHTMGAAGVLETIIGMRAVDAGVVLGTEGFSKSGVSRKLILSPDNAPTQKRSFVKMLSGFGGCNAAALFRKGGALC